MKHLLVPYAHKDVLASWHWKVGRHANVVALSLSGDAFFRDEDGRVQWLDTGAGIVEQVASDEAEFWAVLADPERAGELLLQPVVESFLNARGPFPVGQCLGYLKLPIFGGDYAGKNRVLLPVGEHFLFTGELHERIRDLPDGSQVRIKVVD